MSAKQSTLGEYDDLENRDVYVTKQVSKGAQIYHTDSSCQYVSENHKGISLTHAKDRGLDECQYCSGEVEFGKKSGPQCSVETTKGHRCKNPVAIPALGVCHQHIGCVSESESDDDRPVWERNAGGLK